MDHRLKIPALQCLVLGDTYCYNIFMKLDMLMVLVRLIFSSLQTEISKHLSPFLLNCDKNYRVNSKKVFKEKRTEQLLVQSDGVNFFG